MNNLAIYLLVLICAMVMAQGHPHHHFHPHHHSCQRCSVQMDKQERMACCNAGYNKEFCCTVYVIPNLPPYTNGGVFSSLNQLVRPVLDGTLLHSQFTQFQSQFRSPNKPSQQMNEGPLDDLIPFNNQGQQNNQVPFNQGQQYNRVPFNQGQQGNSSPFNNNPGQQISPDSAVTNEDDPTIDKVVGETPDYEYSNDEEVDGFRAKRSAQYESGTRAEGFWFPEDDLTEIYEGPQPRNLIKVSKPNTSGQ